MEETKNHSAKFAFFYLLSLVALLFMAISTGTVVFQIINKYIADFAGVYSGRYSSEALKFAISALIVSVPIFYVTMVQINKKLFQGKLDSESAVRRWLTYLILLVASVVMIIWIIITINSFLSGELTLKFGLKFLTVLIIAGTTFGYYLYDIKREEVTGKKDKVIKIFFWATLVAVVAVFIAGIFIVESPWETRRKNLDNEVIRDLSSIENAVNSYYKEKGTLPEDLEQLGEVAKYMDRNSLVDPETGEEYEFNVLSDREYELCANFRTSNLEDDNEYRNPFINSQWQHDQGKKCFTLDVEEQKGTNTPRNPEAILED